MIVIANRQTGEVADVRTLAAVEGKAGMAIVRAVASIDVGEVFEGVDINGADSGEEEEGRGEGGGGGSKSEED